MIVYLARKHTQLLSLHNIYIAQYIQACSLGGTLNGFRHLQLLPFNAGALKGSCSLNLFSFLQERIDDLDQRQHRVPPPTVVWVIKHMGTSVIAKLLHPCQNLLSKRLAVRVLAAAGQGQTGCRCKEESNSRALVITIRYLIHGVSASETICAFGGSAARF